jgi:hypothetical protein
MGGMPTGKLLAQIEGLDAKADSDNDDIMSDSGAQVREFQRQSVPTLQADELETDCTPQKEKRSKVDS